MLLLQSLFCDIACIQEVVTATVDLEEVRAYRNDFRSRCVQVQLTI